MRYKTLGSKVENRHPISHLVTTEYVRNSFMPHNLVGLRKATKPKDCVANVMLYGTHESYKEITNVINNMMESDVWSFNIGVTIPPSYLDIEWTSQATHKKEYIHLQSIPACYYMSFRRVGDKKGKVKHWWRNICIQ